MPKEYVLSPYEYFKTEDDDPNRPVVCVKWSRESGDLQIVTRLRENEVFYSEDKNDPIPVEYGWYVDLDRRGINDLIRILRRARDQAFGRDE